MRYGLQLAPGTNESAWWKNCRLQNEDDDRQRCPWQVSGRSDLSWEETVRLDLSYVENWSMVGDLLIIAKTVRAVAGRDGAY